MKLRQNLEQKISKLFASRTTLCTMADNERPMTHVRQANITRDERKEAHVYRGLGWTYKQIAHCVKKLSQTARDGVYQPSKTKEKVRSPSSHFPSTAPGTSFLCVRLTAKSAHARQCYPSSYWLEGVRICRRRVNSRPSSRFGALGNFSPQSSFKYNLF